MTRCLPARFTAKSLESATYPPTYTQVPYHISANDGDYNVRLNINKALAAGYAMNTISEEDFAKVWCPEPGTDACVTCHLCHNGDCLAAGHIVIAPHVVNHAQTLCLRSAHDLLDDGEKVGDFCEGGDDEQEEDHGRCRWVKV